jgi:hypothetical protein
VLVSITKLDSVRSALRVLVHEFSHDAGADGDRGHEWASGEAWADLVELALNAMVDAEVDINGVTLPVRKMTV